MTAATYTKEQMALAYEAAEKCFGVHDDATEEEQAWGLKASEEDAVLSVLSALYPNEWTNTADGIYKLRETRPDLADAWYEISCQGGDLLDMLQFVLPKIVAVNPA